MNKPYFARYLPVEGETKEENMYKMKGAILRTEGAKLIPYKLFLCSRDIQIGDKWFHVNSQGVTSEEQTCTKVKGVVIYSDNMFAPTDSNLYKVIGEISPEATWVKEGDEFDEEECRLMQCHINQYEYESTPVNSRVSKNFRVYCKVKGPCGHFH